ncbi:MAG: 7-dehydrocholesterol reductase [Chlamydiota bacterium]
MKSKIFHQMRSTIGPLFLLVASPSFAMVLWYTCVYLGGSFEQFFQLCCKEGFFSTLYHLWVPYVFGTKTAWQMIVVFALFQLAFMKLMPGKLFYGPLTPKGNIPVYKANGVISFLTTLTLFYLCAYPLKLFSPTIIYDNFGGLIGALNIFSLFFCLFLYFKGRFAPSCTDSGTSGNVVFDYYWGTELYPRILGWDIKMFTNCRFGMMSWGLIILSFAAKQHALHGLSNSMLISVALQMIYIFKFFCWETGYLRSLDIMYDRAGFYICWGCLVWVPSIYTSPALYLVNHPNQLGQFVAVAIFVCGAFAIFINYQADRQRQKLRMTSGNCKIWGKKPNYTLANFVTENGEKKESLLLLSGWWGISRHFHYIPELFGAFFWTLPALFSNFLPFFYFVFLSILLFDRAMRDDSRCAKKYGKDWEKHCAKVRYKIIPFIY